MLESIAALEAAATQDEVYEAGVTYATSPLFVVWRDEKVAAVCGYDSWVGVLAHMMVLTHPDHRGQGSAPRPRRRGMRSTAA